ncbi:hypothetical protein BC830DRAFT_1077155 [Chytriomyces sp. MP71]|nr:hypothetical protein BC830DRAFT_1077155 [Chytriomyces sp. MP71]
MSEIDDIFGGKRKGGKSRSLPVSKSPTPTIAAKPLKRRKDDVTQHEHQPPSATPTDSKKKAKKTLDSTNASQPVDPTKPAVETVDFRFAAPTVRPIPPKLKKQDGDDDGFSDSRGLKKGSRKSTDDGLRVFDNVELQIGAGAGDTPDCPFDCWCCF